MAVKDLAAHYGGHIISIPRDNLPVLSTQDGAGALYNPEDEWEPVTVCRRQAGATRAVTVPIEQQARHPWSGKYDRVIPAEYDQAALDYERTFASNGAGEAQAAAARNLAAQQRALSGAAAAPAAPAAPWDTETDAAKVARA